ncbi:hypothetical protein TIFTF001_036180 [Ficus carica]|uniref:Uncharacterized protein n=1 Tax=Ficus carica TaxID=3494 RepID=A0AA88E3R7_FICCA|nr:hypothetical protein TIFTF001_036180 [Ficus carica]
MDPYQSTSSMKLVEANQSILSFALLVAMEARKCSQQWNERSDDESSTVIVEMPLPTNLLNRHDVGITAVRSLKLKACLESNVDDGHGGRRFSDSSDGVEEAEGRSPMGDQSAPDLEFFLPHSNVDDGHGGRRFSDGSDGVEEAEGRSPWATDLRQIWKSPIATLDPRQRRQGDRDGAGGGNCPLWATDFGRIWTIGDPTSSNL